MSEVREHLAYTEEHEWALAVDGQFVRVGITDYAQSLLGDIVFVECPEPGTKVTAGECMGTIESVKTVSDLFSPVTGTVVKVNETLIDQPELMNGEPYEGGWIVEVAVDGNVGEALGKLLTAEQYRSKI